MDGSSSTVSDNSGGVRLSQFGDGGQICVVMQGEDGDDEDSGNDKAEVGGGDCKQDEVHTEQQGEDSENQASGDKSEEEDKAVDEEEEDNATLHFLNAAVFGAVEVDNGLGQIIFYSPHLYLDEETEQWIWSWLEEVENLEGDYRECIRLWPINHYREK